MVQTIDKLKDYSEITKKLLGCMYGRPVASRMEWSGWIIEFSACSVLVQRELELERGTMQVIIYVCVKRGNFLGVRKPCKAWDTAFFFPNGCLGNLLFAG